MQTSISWRVLALGAALFGVAATGCVDPEGEYSDFKDREKNLSGSGGEAGASGDGGTCTPPAVADLDGGTFLFALSSKLSPKLPILFTTNVTATEAAGEVKMVWKLTPLAYWDRTTPLPPEITFEESTIAADGTWTADPPVIAVPGDANPLTHAAIEADVVLNGNFCSGAAFYCGSVGGKVVKPISLDLAPGSNFSFEKIEGGTNPDPIKINCKGDPADPAPAKT